MIKILENNLQDNRTKNIETGIEEIIKRLKALKENFQFTPEKYDLEILLDILSQIYDEIGDFCIVADSGNTIRK